MIAYLWLKFAFWGIKKSNSVIITVFSLFSFSRGQFHHIHLNLFDIDPLEEENNELAGKSMQRFWPSFRLICGKRSGVLRGFFS